MAACIGRCASSFFKAGCSLYRGCHRQHPHQTTRRTTRFRATSYKLQSMVGLARTLGGREQLARTLQWMMSGTVVVSVVMLWRNRADYALKAAALAAARSCSRLICFSKT
jgi:hypothetical protein